MAGGKGCAPVFGLSRRWLRPLPGGAHPFFADPFRAGLAIEKGGTGQAFVSHSYQERIGRKLQLQSASVLLDLQISFHNAKSYLFLHKFPRNFGCVSGMVTLENSCDCGGVESRHARGPKP
ncbi:hypothetical protein ADP8_05220 [Roseomonas mucosa]|nr:hypothetical protein ADP8_05220 [Roseomonas mucosa]